MHATECEFGKVKPDDLVETGGTKYTNLDSCVSLHTSLGTTLILLGTSSRIAMLTSVYVQDSGVPNLNVWHMIYDLVYHLGLSSFALQKIHISEYVGSKLISAREEITGSWLWNVNCRQLSKVTINLIVEEPDEGSGWVVPVEYNLGDGDYEALAETLPHLKDFYTEDPLITKRTGRHLKSHFAPPST